MPVYIELYDICTCNNTVVDYQQLYEQELASKQELLALVDMLKHELDQLKKMIYGSRHERFTSVAQNPAQLSLDIDRKSVV